MLKRLKIQSLISTLVFAQAIVNLPLSRTLSADPPSSKKTHDSQAAEESSLDFFRQSLEKISIDWLSELAKTLPKLPSDASAEDVAAAIKGAAKKADVNLASNASLLDELQEAAKGVREDLSEDAIGTLSAVTAAELAARAKSAPDQNSGTSGIATAPSDGRSLTDKILAELIRRKLDEADKLQRKLEEQKDQAKKDADKSKDLTPEELARLLADNKKKGHGNDSGSGSPTGGGTGGGSPSGGGGDDSGQNPQNQNPNNQSPQDKLKDLANLLSQVGNDPSTTKDKTPAPETSDNSKSKSRDRNDTTSSLDDTSTKSNTDTSTSSDSSTLAKTPSTNSFNGLGANNPLPAKQPLPSISGTLGGVNSGATGLGGDPNASYYSSSGYSQGFRSSSTTGGSSVLDASFASIGAPIPMPPKMSYRYLKSGAEAYGESSSGGEAPIAQGDGATSKLPRAALSMDGSITPRTVEPFVAQSFNAVSQAVGALCINGNLNCASTEGFINKETQP